MQLSEASIEEFKTIYKKKTGKELSNAEAAEGARNLVNFFKTLYDCEVKDAKRKHRLKKEPAGFHLMDGTYNCLVCGTMITGEKSWYDKWGMKCLPCQKAIEAGVIPGFICKERDSRYLMWELKSDFGIHSSTAKKMIRDGKLNARIVMNENGHPYEYIFLKKENLGLISRHSPERKSYDRNRKKESAQRMREWKLKMKEELKKKPKKS